MKISKSHGTLPLRTTYRVFILKILVEGTRFPLPPLGQVGGEGEYTQIFGGREAQFYKFNGKKLYMTYFELYLS